MLLLLYLIGGLAVILFCAEIFTNGVEWLGKRLKLSEGAVGSVLAAVGTALPEAIIPVIAILLGTGEAAHEIGIGAILGAPFMLATLALCITGIAALVYTVNGQKRQVMLIDHNIMKRDLLFFIIVYSLAILAAFLPAAYKLHIAFLLVVAYIIYVTRTIKAGSKLGETQLKPLYFARKHREPSIRVIVLQVFVALAGIVTGANFFVDGIERVAELMHISPFIVSIFIAPIATELPEKFNSLIWVRQGKDTLALGNITGAMVFQSSLIPALGIVLTPWVLSDLALISAILALAGAGLIYLSLQLKKYIRPATLVLTGSLYVIFVMSVFII
ncbi:sodium:calcium antiporter [Desulfallas thermosapovorans]|uniref:Cation:H+ antiporter n=1 Tax=Desulfallas thermosapovorans DSM 6562 TaxID=1121431 RepID=A0A5S4ZVY5_9FIRM|nr:sodium:calcium antiporter [Desulfallas thermosapovorans]TYO97175.1 cation:H+ antiporter [Desulfallas thermosapovorans DSM 6562]